MAGAGDRNGERSLVSELARRWANQRLTAVQAYGRILADYGSGRSTSTAAAGALARLAAEEAVRYPADALVLATDAAAALLRGGEMPAAASQASAFSRTAPAGAPMQDLELMGPLGDQASAEFRLRNPHDRAVVLTFATSNFIGPAGETGATVRLDPPEFTLPPGGEQLIIVSAGLDPQAFAPGGPYLANVAIAGFDDMVVRVRLMVLEPT